MLWLLKVAGVNTTGGYCRYHRLLQITGVDQWVTGVHVLGSVFDTTSCWCAYQRLLLYSMAAAD